MSRELETINAAFTAYQRGDLPRARALLGSVSHPQASHLLGLVERKAGNLAAVSEHLQRAAERDPRNHEVANNQGRVALDAGQGERAEAYFRRALGLRPGWEAATEGLARSLNEQKRWHEALQIWQSLLKQGAQRVPILYGLAMAELETGAVEAASQRYDKLIAQGVQDPAVWFMRGRARLELTEIEGGLSDLQTAWRLQPSTHVLRNLANTLWMLGELDAFDALLSELPDELAVLGVVIRHEAGQTDAALTAWQALPEAVRTGAMAQSVRSRIAKDLGDAAAASEYAEFALRQDRENVTVQDAAICARLMQGDAKAALDLLTPLRQGDPHNQHWLAHQTTAHRLLGDGQYEHLVQLDKHVRTFELAVPSGYQSLAEFNQALAAAIKPVRGFTAHPLDQSFVFGAQTSRDLVSVQDPVIQAYIQALDDPIRAYLAEIGSAADHPLTARNTGKYRFNGCWSVELQGGGRHVNHVHPQGWISSAYYISVPEPTEQSSEKAGWIKFGELPFTTRPDLSALKWVQPKAGMLVLFPSYLWHGTEPTAPGTHRITAPFDLVPA